jgi:hypothetical protein
MTMRTAAGRQRPMFRFTQDDTFRTRDLLTVARHLQVATSPL